MIFYLSSLNRCVKIIYICADNGVPDKLHGHTGEEILTGADAAAEPVLDAATDGTDEETEVELMGSLEMEKDLGWSRHNKPKKAHIDKIVAAGTCLWFSFIDSFFYCSCHLCNADYICNEEDIGILVHIISAPGKTILVDISGAFVDRNHMSCLFCDTYLNGDVSISIKGNHIQTQSCVICLHYFLISIYILILKKTGYKCIYTPNQGGKTSKQ